MDESDSNLNLIEFLFKPELLSWKIKNVLNTKNYWHFEKSFAILLSLIGLWYLSL
jgi:hypothetical protein